MTRKQQQQQQQQQNSNICIRPYFSSSVFFLFCSIIRSFVSYVFFFSVLCLCVCSFACMLFALKSLYIDTYLEYICYKYTFRRLQLHMPCHGRVPETHHCRAMIWAKSTNSTLVSKMLKLTILFLSFVRSGVVVVDVHSSLFLYI